MRILFAISEAYPFVKVGGLGDVGAALPAALADLRGEDHDVRLVLPSYPSLRRGPRVLDVAVPLGRTSERVEARFLGRHGGVTVYSVGNARFHRPDPYGYEGEDVAPFVVFCRAVVELAAFWRRRGEWTPDVVHVHDWHTALVAEELRRGPHATVFARTPTVVTIHNLAHQGPVSPRHKAVLGLPGQGNLLARGVAFADTVTTVSARYLAEIQTPTGGYGLDKLLRSRRDDLHAVPNGLDTVEFDPRTDPFVACRYDGSVATGKRMNKAELQRLLGLPPDPTLPLLGMVARLVDQKGVDLVLDALDELLAAGGSLVVVGRGDERYERALTAAATRHPTRVAVRLSRAEDLARQVYAGADMFLVPSRREPFGLSPLIALRYGTVPIVRRTGGLAETVPDCRETPEGLGFAFDGESPGELAAAARAAIEHYAQPRQWTQLRRRAMAVDFTWEQPAGVYTALYHTSIRRRATAGGVRRLPAPASTPGSVPLALVHHANQFLITNGYEDREGIEELVYGYAAVLRLHERYGVPANLHLSGTLLEAAAWHAPELLDSIRRLRTAGLVELVGGTYAENVMPLFPPEFNRRQLARMLALYERHLDCDPQQVRVAWVPERVWDTERVGSVLRDPTLANGGYTAVLLDDRLLYRGPQRAAFDDDAQRVADGDEPKTSRRRQWTDSCASYSIDGADGLLLLPLSTELRYWIPPVSDDDWRHLDELLAALHAPDPSRLLVFADDMERTAGVGPWDVRMLERFEEFLAWASRRPDLKPVLLSQRIAGDAGPRRSRRVDSGTYAELCWRGAGDDYAEWAQDLEWAPYHRHQEIAAAAVAAVTGADERLLELARDHLLASTFETGWQEFSDGRYRPAPWARAVASHARHCLPLVDAARWIGSDGTEPTAVVTDVDQDGEDEVVLRAAGLYAVVAPRHGGRVVLLAVRGDDGGVVVVGNPTDDWNWQEELNRYMDVPPNHPGAFADVGFEHDRFEVAGLSPPGKAWVDLIDGQPGSVLAGSRKRLTLSPRTGGVTARYVLAPGVPSLAVDVCLSPDYARLRGTGRGVLNRLVGWRWRGARVGAVAAWVDVRTSHSVRFCPPAQAEVGHGVMLRVRSAAPVFSVVLGTGYPPGRATDIH